MCQPQPSQPQSNQPQPIVGIICKRANVARSTQRGTVEVPQCYVSDALAQAVMKSGVVVRMLPLPVRLTTFAITDSDVSKQQALSPFLAQLEECSGFILQPGNSFHSYETAVAMYALLHNIPLLGFGNAERIMRDATSQSRDAKHNPSHKDPPVDLSDKLERLNAAVAETKYQVVTFKDADKAFYYCVKPRTYFAAEDGLDADESFAKNLDPIIEVFLSALS